LARGDAVTDIGAVKSGNDQTVLLYTKLHQYVFAGMLVRRGRQRNARNIGEMVEQRAQQAIIGSEIMPPFRYAVRFIYGEKGNAGLLKQVAKMVARSAFGGGIEQVQFACFEPRDSLGPVVIGRGKRCCADTHGFGAA